MIPLPALRLRFMPCPWPVGPFVLACTVFLGGCGGSGAGGLLTTDAQRAVAESRLGESGLLMLERGDFAGAERGFQAILHARPGDLEARIGLAEAQLGLGRLAEARKGFSALVDTDVKARALQGLGLTELRADQPAAAEAALTTAVTLQPALWRAWNALAQLHDRTQRWSAAAAAYETAQRLAPYPEIVINNRGMSAMGQRDYPTAIARFEEALTLNPDLKIAETNRRLALAFLDRYDDATDDLDRLTRARALNNAGYVAMVKGDAARAKGLFLRAIETDPAFYAKAYQNLEQLLRTSAAAGT